MPDDVNFDVESFNRRVVNENFNRVICQQLAGELTDPQQLQKALDSPGEIKGETQAGTVLSQLSTKVDARSA